MHEYEERYRSVDLKRINVFAVDNIEECAWLMLNLDELVVDIEDQLKRAIDNLQTGKEVVNPVWMRSAERALRETRIKRQALQERRGQLKRARHQANGSRPEKLFVDVARELLPAELFERVWARVAELREGAK
jgi:hypothetical protein